jgi:hypothetical protein
MLLPDHLPERPNQDSWPAELRGDEQAVSAQLAEYAQAGVDDLIVCDYGIEPGCRLAALAWLASVMTSFQAITGAER